MSRRRGHSEPKTAAPRPRSAPAFSSGAQRRTTIARLLLALSTLSAATLAPLTSANSPAPSSQPPPQTESWVTFESGFDRSLLTGDAATSVLLSPGQASIRFRSLASAIENRQGGSLNVRDDLRLNVGLSDLIVNQAAPQGSLSLPGLERATVSKMAEATLELDVARAGLLTFTAMAGGRGAFVEGTSATAVGGGAGAGVGGGASAIAVAGGGASLTISDTSLLRGSAMTSVEPLGGSPYLEGRVEAIIKLSTNSELSLGWQYLSGTLPILNQRGTLKRDAILFEVRIGF